MARADRATARLLLEEQTRLVGIQIRREGEELGALRAQRLLRWLMIALVAGTVLLLAVSLWRASQARGLIFAPFTVAPDLAQRGLSGEVVANRLLDEFADLHNRTQSTRPPESFANNWDDRIDVDIPQTGVSIGEAWRLLRSWLGDETRVSGELVRSGAGFELLVRAGREPAIRVAGPDADALPRQAALALLARTQPYRHITYMWQSGRAREAVAAARQLALNGPLTERGWGYVAWGNIVQSPALLARGMAMVPDSPMPPGNIAGYMEDEGHLEDELRYLRRSLMLSERSPEAISEQFRDYLVQTNRARMAAATFDFAEGRRRFDAGESSAPPGRGWNSAAQSAQMSLSLHDPVAAIQRTARMLDEHGVTPDAPPIAMMVQALVAAERGDRADFVRRTQALLARWESLGALPSQSAGRLRQLRQGSLAATLGAAALSLGDPAYARALVAGASPRCQTCALVRAEADAATGDRGRAAQQFRRVIAEAPSSALPPLAYGRALLAQGKSAAAIVMFRQAHRLGPRWADPLKLWGDALAAQGDWRGASRRYAAAAERAPRWGTLHVASARALRRQGRDEEAAAKLRAARSMSLTPADEREARRLASMKS